MILNFDAAYLSPFSTDVESNIFALIKHYEPLYDSENKKEDIEIAIFQIVKNLKNANA